MKLFLEQNQYYDKSRKISPLENSAFGVPLVSNIIDNPALIIPTELQSIITQDNIIASCSLDSSFSMKQKVSQFLEKWCMESPLLFFNDYY